MKLRIIPFLPLAPLLFFVSEKGIKGKQTWKKGQHFHGAEITIYKKYFDEIIRPNFPKTIDFDNFISNYTYRYLPLEISAIIQKLRSMSEVDKITPIYLESKILENFFDKYASLPVGNGAFSYRR